MTLFETNIHLLKPSFQKILIEHQIEYHNWQIMNSKENTPTLKWKNDLLLHSAYYPSKEAVKLVKSLQISSSKIIIIYGFGFGYHIEALIRQNDCKNKVIIIVEGNMDVLKLALENRSLVSILSDDRIKLIIGISENDIIKEFYGEMKLLSDETIDFIIHEPSFKILNKSWKKIYQLFENKYMDQSSKYFHINDVKNNIKSNLDEFIYDPGVDQIFNQLPKAGALIVGAGPSLDYEIMKIKELSQRMYVFSSDTALETLIQEKINVDFVLSIDPQSDTQNHFRNVNPNQSILIYFPSSHYQTVQKFKGRRIAAIQHAHSVYSILEPVLKNKGITYSGHSVSCVLLDMTAQYGFNPIVICGVDGGFPLGDIYSTQILKKKISNHGVNRFLTFETLGIKRVLNEFDEYIEADNGSYIPTKTNLRRYMKELESIISKYNKINYYRLGSAGAKLKNATPIEYLHQIEVDAKFVKKQLDLLDLNPVKIDKNIIIQVEYFLNKL